MTLTQKEIFSQYHALRKTFDYLIGKGQDIQAFLSGRHYDKIGYMGCGSGYCLCRSGEWITRQYLNKPSFSMAAGDLMLNFQKYIRYLENSLLITPSRSGATSELLLAAERLNREQSTSFMAICAQRDSELSKIADITLEIPWAFDESVCQTRSVTNLYMAILTINAIIAADVEALKDIELAITMGESFIQQNTEILRMAAQGYDWDNVVVLGDCEMQGIASEAAIAFTEISQLPAWYFHILDVRHGPIVTINERSLVVIALSPYDEVYQKTLIKDLKSKGAIIIAIGAREIEGVDLFIQIPQYKSVGTDGIPFIFVPQALAFFKAEKLGINPDVPNGLKPWIDLN